MNSDTSTPPTRSASSLLIRDNDPLRSDLVAVRWLSRYTAEDRQLGLAEAGRPPTRSRRSASTGGSGRVASTSRRIEHDEDGPG